MVQTLTKPQIIENLSDKDYRNSSGLGDGRYITRSMIGCYIDDPSLFKLRYIDGDPNVWTVQNEGMKFGQYCEDLIVNGDVSKYAIIPDTYANAKNEVKDWNWNAGVCKAWKKKNRDFITKDKVIEAEFIKKRFADTAMGQYWLKTIPQSRKQLTVRWTDEESGLNCQVRIDNEVQGKYLCDAKTTGKRLEGFSGIADDYYYHIQHAMYQDGYRIATGQLLPFLFAVAETGKKSLQRARILTLHGLQVQAGLLAYKRALMGIKIEDFAAVGATNTEPMECELPAWLLYRYESQ